MNVERLNSPKRVIELWDLFREGLTNISKLTGECISEDEYCKLLVNLVARDDAWVGVAIQGGPLSYGVAVESTPPHCSRRTYTINSFYAMPGRPDATEDLMRAFESWARAQGISSYVVTTRRDTGAAIKCFQSGRYGFRRSYLAFEKQL